MEVLRITAEGITASFRYPHFMLGIQPTFEMPPPSTIYGHIASTLGEWFAPEGVAFAYHFTYQAKFDDVEHIHVLSGAGGKLPGTIYPKVLEGAVNPYKRAMLFAPKLVLYINKPEWERAFRTPKYPVALGRSQDLFTYTNIETVQLDQASQVYFEHTLAPFEFTMQTTKGYSVLMPRYLDYGNRRRPVFERYVVLNRRVHSSDFLTIAGEEKLFWIDTESSTDRDCHLGLLFHTFVGEGAESYAISDLAR